MHVVLPTSAQASAYRVCSHAHIGVGESVQCAPIPACPKSKFSPHFFPPPLEMPRCDSTIVIGNRQNAAPNFSNSVMVASTSLSCILAELSTLRTVIITSMGKETNCVFFDPAPSTHDIYDLIVYFPWVMQYGIADGVTIQWTMDRSNLLSSDSKPCGLRQSRDENMLVTDDWWMWEALLMTKCGSSNFETWICTMGNPDLSEELALTAEELECNDKVLEDDQVTEFDQNFTLSNMSDGFRIFAFEESLNKIPARRFKIPGPRPTIMTVFLHAHILHAGQFEPSLEVMIKTVMDNSQENKTLSLTFDRPEILLNFSSALLGGLLFVLQNTQRNVPLLICSSSEFLAGTLVKERENFENDLLDPKFRLLNAVFAGLNERVTRIQFKECIS
ncbi:hypothetical protein C8R44DRAFT_749032 [Mycena epipterygia]|nr:hypothetical protein C8R44DRAFT_749032 [Mycena epipterygia]